jgi:hypothetical protein
MPRMVDVVRHTRLHVRLAYYPPYHSTYPPLERCGGSLEHHGHGARLDAVEAVMASAQTMTWKGLHATVEGVTTTDKRGVQRTQHAMMQRQTPLQRVHGLEQWFVDIYPPPNAWDT